YAEPLPPPTEMTYGVAPPPLPAPTPMVPQIAAPPMPVVERLAVEQVRTEPGRRVLRAIMEDGQARLELCNSGDFSATCESMNFKLKGGAGFRLSAANKQVHLEGPSFRASADTITPGGPEDRFILEGHVTLKSDRDGQHVDVKAERVVVNLAEGSFEVK